MTEPHWRVEFAPRARKELDRLDRLVQRRIIAALERLAAEPRISGDIKRLTGSEEYRLRVGDWRVRFLRDNDVLVITVIRVAHRSSVYDR